MSHFDQALIELSEQVDRLRQLKARAASLQAQVSELESKVQDLKTSFDSEQDDVRRLEGDGLKALLYKLAGRYDDKLSKEQEEMIAAQAKLDVAVKELKVARDELDKCQSEQMKLRDCERRFAELLNQKEAMLRKSNTAGAAEILRLEAEIASLENYKTELQEAIAAGLCAQQTAAHVASSLDSADGFAIWDVVGGGLITDLMKHSCLDDAQNQVYQLQEDLRHFRTELADVSIQADLQVNMDGFLRFADYFFDGIFVDWAVRDRINNSQEQVDRTHRQIGIVLKKLNDLLSDTQQRQDAARLQIKESVLKAQL